MLRFYGYFKQGTEGSCTGRRPAFWDIVGRWEIDEGFLFLPKFNHEYSLKGRNSMPGSDWVRCRERKRWLRTLKSYKRLSKRWVTQRTLPIFMARLVTWIMSASKTSLWWRPQLFKKNVPTPIRLFIHEKQVQREAFQIVTQMAIRMGTVIAQQTLQMTTSISTQLR